MPSPANPLLKQFLDTSKKPTVVLGKVERHLLRQQSERDYSYLHPSDIVNPKWCLREAWFLLNGREKITDPLSLRLASIFAEGHTIHDKWQGWFTEKDELNGVWECQDHTDKWSARRSHAHQDGDAHAHAISHSYGRQHEHNHTDPLADADCHSNQIADADRHTNRCADANRHAHGRAPAADLPRHLAQRGDVLPAGWRP